MNIDSDLDAMLAFFTVSSSIYPQIDALYRQRVKEGMASSWHGK